MTNTERFGAALTRVRAGESIGSIIKALYRNGRNYKKQSTEEQRSALRHARWEYMAMRPKKSPKGRRRIIFNVPEEERIDELNRYCRDQKITVSRFLNKILLEALARVRNKPS